MNGKVYALSILLLAGSISTALLDWRQEKQQTLATARRSAEGLIGLLSLYPIATTDIAIRQLLGKTIVENSAPEVAYLIAQSRDGEPLLTLGNPGLRPTTRSASPFAQSQERRFKAADGSGDIIEFNRAIVAASNAGIVRLGVYVAPPPFFSIDRLSSVAAVLFLMFAAAIVGYYAIVLSVRRWIGSEIPMATTGAKNPDDNIIDAMEKMSLAFASARDKLQQTADQNAALSSQLGVVSFESKQAYSILDGLAFGVLILDPQGRIRRVNRRMLELLDCTRPKLEGHNCGDVLLHEDLSRLVEKSHDSPTGEQSSMDTLFPDTAPGRHFELSQHRLSDATGDGIGILITTQDVTRLKRAQERQQDFLEQATHELLTPLTSIKGFSELLATGDYDDTAQQKEFFNTINEETDRLTNLVRNLLSNSQLEAEHLAIEHELVKTDWLVMQCLPAVEASAREKNITIEKRLPDVYPTLRGDRELLKVVLINVLGNAVKYTPRGGIVHLSLFQRDRHVFIEVADNGCGIAPDEIPHVFEKFYRGGSEDVRNEAGSGIGLATALQLVHLHGGDIDVTSSPETGSCFTIRIPAEDFTLE
jgi:two-component system phosphate regulon sensor histidine kinase PhoR